jgi:hypothetical protein
MFGKSRSCRFRTVTWRASRIAGFAVGLTCVLAVSVAAAASSAAPTSQGWSRLLPVSRPPSGLSQGSIVIGAKGVEIASWWGSNASSSGYSTWVSVRPAGARSWPVPRSLSGQVRDSGSPSVAVAPSGRAVVVWDQVDRPYAPLRWALMPVGSSHFGAIHLMPAVSRRDSWIPEIVATPSGEFVAMWEAGDRARRRTDRVFVSTLPTGSRSWTPPVALSGRILHAHPMALGVDGAGSVVAAWGDDHEMRISRLAAGATRWKSAERLSGGSPGDARLATGTDGSTVLVWLADGLHASVERPGADRFDASRRIGHRRIADGVSDMTLAVSPNGSATLVWTTLVSHVRVVESSQATRPSLTGLSYLESLPAGASRWERPRRFTAAGQSRGPIGLAYSQTGELVALWSQQVDGLTSRATVMEATQQPGSATWTTPAVLATRPNVAESIALTDDGPRVIGAYGDFKGLFSLAWHS